MVFVMPVFLSACADFLDLEYEEVEWEEESDYKYGIFSGESAEGGGWVIYSR